METRNQNHFEGIADGLAEKGYAIVDHFLDDAEITSILQTDEFRNHLLLFKKAGIGADKQVNELQRGDHILWVDQSTAPPALNKYLDKLGLLLPFLNQSLFLSLKGAEVHLTVYPAGACYKRHLDQFRHNDHRKLSIIIYLNKDWSEKNGGQLRLHLDDGQLNILPLSGRLVCFRSELIEHEVLSADRERLSITGWLVDKA